MTQKEIMDQIDEIGNSDSFYKFHMMYILDDIITEEYLEMKAAMEDLAQELSEENCVKYHNLAWF